MNRLQKGTLLLVLLLILSCLIGCTAAPAADTKPTLTVTFLDVEDGDCILLTQSDGFAMMIDTARVEHRALIERTLEKLGIKTLDILLLTHPDSDHIGNAQWIIETYEVKQLYQIDRKHNSKTYDKLQTAIQSKRVPMTYAQPGVTFSLGQAKGEFLGPISVNTPMVNNASAVLRLTYGEKVFLFMGDAQWSAESLLILHSPTLLKADVLKVGHHGLHSTSAAFLNAVAPAIAVVSTANPSHSANPEEHRQSLKDIARRVGQLLRTDELGTIVLVSDGQSVVVKP